MTYKKGQSGNPKGRPKGSKDRRSAVRALLEPHAPALVAKVVEQAMAGETAALKLCIDRLIPPLSSDAPAVRINASAKDVAKAGEAVLQHAFAGEISPTAAHQFMRSLHTQSQIADIETIIKRIEALEAQLNETRN